jgi:hypothetical protein
MYFISKDNKKEGPYTLDEVLAMRLTDDMLVWKEGINWSKVSELPELMSVVIKTPPLLPSEVQKEYAAKRKALVVEVKKKFAWDIVWGSLLVGLLIAILLSYCLAIYAETGGTNEYPIYQYPGRDWFWYFFPGVLAIVEIVCLIVAGILIFKYKPEEGYKVSQSQPPITYDTDKGIVKIFQRSPANFGEINKDDVVMIESKNPTPDGKVSVDFIPASNGRYVFRNNANYVFVHVTNGIVSSLLKVEDK